jgi:hypothetical protein
MECALSRRRRTSSHRRGAQFDIPSIEANWYFGYCHKWPMAPKGSAFIWASPTRQTETHATDGARVLSMSSTGLSRVTRRPAFMFPRRSIGTPALATHP